MAVVRFKLKADPGYTDVELEDGVAGITVGKLKEAITQVKFGGSTGAFGLKLQNVQTKEGMPLCRARVALNPRAG